MTMMKNSNGAIAQLGERLHGMQEVVGSSPISSTKKHAAHMGGVCRFKLKLEARATEFSPRMLPDGAAQLSSADH